MQVDLICVICRLGAGCLKPIRQIPKTRHRAHGGGINQKGIPCSFLGHQMKCPPSNCQSCWHSSQSNHCCRLVAPFQVDGCRGQANRPQRVPPANQSKTPATAAENASGTVQWGRLGAHRPVGPQDARKEGEVAHWDNNSPQLPHQKPVQKQMAPATLRGTCRN